MVWRGDTDAENSLDCERDEEKSFAKHIFSNLTEANRGFWSMLLPPKEIDYISFCEDIFSTPVMSRQDTINDVDVSSNLLESESAGRIFLTRSLPSMPSTDSPIHISPKPQTDRKTDTPFKPLGALYVRLAQTSCAVKVVRRSIAPAIRDSDHSLERDPALVQSVLNLVPSAFVNDLFLSDSPTFKAELTHRHSIALERRQDSGQDISSPLFEVRGGRSEGALTRPSLDFRASTSMFANLAPSASSRPKGFDTPSRLIVC